MPWVSEGQAQFRVEGAFYRSKSRITRDLGVLAATCLRQDLGQLRVLDAMTGCGVRSLRYALEAEADFLWVNDGNPDLHPLIQDNLSRHVNSERYHLSFLSLQKLFATLIIQDQRFDWVDLDCFGSPGPSLAGAIATTTIGGCLYLTATDGKSLSGQQSGTALRQFNAYTRHHPAFQEQGLRVLAGFAVQQARNQGLDCKPIFSFFCGQTYRVLIQLLPKAPAHKKDYGFLGYCHTCGDYQTLHWRSLNREQCRHHDFIRPLVVSGPMWLGPLHNPSFLMAMYHLAQSWDWPSLLPLLTRMQAESHLPPYYFPLAEVGKRGQMDIPPRDRLIQALQEHGYEACIASMVSQAIKTNAPFPDLLNIARKLSR